MRLARLLAGLAALAAPACNAVFDIEEAREVSADHDLSDGQEERGRFDLRDVGDAAPAPAERVCATGQKVCCETDLFSSRSCGACGNVCPSEERFCLRGTCSPTSQ